MALHGLYFSKTHPSASAELYYFWQALDRVLNSKFHIGQNPPTPSGACLFQGSLWTQYYYLNSQVENLEPPAGSAYVLD